MVTLFILLLLILGGVFLYLKQQEDESETETEPGSETESDATETKAKAKKKAAAAEVGADKARAAEAKAKKDADRAAALLAKNKGDASLKAALQKAKAKAKEAEKARAAAAAKAKKRSDDLRASLQKAKAAADARAKKEAADRAAALAAQKKRDDERRRKLAEAAKKRAAALAARKKAIEDARRKKQAALNNWGTGMGGGISGPPKQGHYAVIGAKTGYLAQINNKLTNKGGKMKMTMRQCHDLGRDLQKKKWPVSAVGYRTSAHPDPKWKNTCFFYGNWDHDGEKTTVPTGARLTGNSDKNHTIACMNPGEILEKGCKKQGYINNKRNALMAKRREVARKKRAEQDRLNEMPYGVHRKLGYPKHGWVNDKLNQSYAKIKNQSAKQCRDHAVTINKEAPGFVRVWGHYRSNYPDKNKRNTCFFYTKNKSFMTHNDPKPPHFHGRAPWNGDGRHVSGCVEGGKRLESGCKDPRKINQERAAHRRKVHVPGNISRQTGYRAGSTNLNMKPHQLKATGPNECRELAIKLNKSTKGAIKAWGFRNSRHNATWKNTCFFYTGKGPHGGRGGTHNHITGCLKPGDNVDWGCTRTRPVNCRQQWTGWSACTKPCGGGTQRRDYKTITPARGIGTPCKTASGAYAPKIRACNAHACRPTARYVTIRRYDRQYTGNGNQGTLLNLNLLQVWSNGRDVARGRPVRMYSRHSGFYGRHLTDGNANSMAHTWWRNRTHGRPSRYAWMKVDLGREYPIDYVWIMNRKDCCQDRLKGTNIILKHGRKTPGAGHTRYEVMRSDAMTDSGAGWNYILWQPAIGGTLGPQRVPGSYWRKYRIRDASSDD
jgi:hypothetical protein